MTYDWEGQRTRRIQLFRFVTAIMAGLIVPAVITAWQFIT